MFNSFKEKFQTVQGNISASLRGLSLGETSESSPAKGSHADKLNLNVGCDILEHFQTSWTELHSDSCDNAKKAEVVDQLIGKLHGKLETEWSNINQLASALTKLPEVIHEIDLLSERLDMLGDLFASVERSLIHLEDVIETRTLQERQLDQRYQLALYEEKKLKQLGSLAQEMTKKLASHEVRQQAIQKERQQAFEQQFKQDIAHYKETHSLPLVERRNLHSPEVKLEEVVLDIDDQQALDEFLHESTPERQEEAIHESTPERLEESVNESSPENVVDPMHENTPDKLEEGSGASP